MVAIRQAMPRDAKAWCELRHTFWPQGSREQHAGEIAAFFAGKAKEPLVVLLAEGKAGEILGLAELSIRSCAEGCVTDRIAYLEGWYVVPSARGQGIGRALVEASETWARAQGCQEFASDTGAENESSAAAHHAVGFAEVALVRCFRKSL